jgi:8-oxo-dGTP diphosphatase
MSQFFITYVDENTVLPKKELLSAVFLIAIDGDKILAIENERGWEIPGGHIEKGETHEEALIREVQEEAGASFRDAKLFSIIGSDNQDKYKDTVMLVYVTKNFKLGEFTSSEDAFGREIIEIGEFLKRYPGRIEFKELISKAQKFVSNSDW